MRDTLSLNLHSQSTRFLLTMALNFETTHEYYMFGSELYYCEQHDALIISKDHEDRVLINGISKDTMLSFARKLIQEDLDKTLAKYENKEVNSEDKEVSTT